MTSPHNVHHQFTSQRPIWYTWYIVLFLKQPDLGGWRTMKWDSSDRLEPSTQSLS